VAENDLILLGIQALDFTKRGEESWQIRRGKLAGKGG